MFFVLEFLLLAVAVVIVVAVVVIGEDQCVMCLLVTISVVTCPTNREKRFDNMCSKEQ